ncbi:hypothetical protein Taro_013615 [Colocasia esculenta]|uniref:Uncharacterized protein n=1 Tax=Colocasia esculenta TaxID=4460 RepID=A0A843UJA3_COLES|nr:hypothetical protein [Colocasia esculenta]
MNGKKGAVDRWLQTELRFAGLCVSVDSNQGICRQIHTVQNLGVLEDMRLSTALGWLSTELYIMNLNQRWKKKKKKR